MQDFQYYTPTKVYFGHGAENKVGEVLRERGYHKILIHYGGGSVKASGLLDRITANLSTAGLSYVELGGVAPNPKLDEVRSGSAFCVESGADFILAVGGGSVIDSAKSIGMAAATGMDPWDTLMGVTTPQTTIPVGVVLTIAAAGSEMSDSHVITNAALHMKRGRSLDLIRPAVAFLNPELTCSVSPFQTGCGIVDIMMHTMERYFTLDSDTDLTDQLSEGLLRSVMQAGRAALAKPNDYEARATLMWASSLSHNGLTGCGKKYFFTVHKMEHDVSGVFDHISHGAGLSVLFPAWASFAAQQYPAKFAQFAVRVMGLPAEGDQGELAQAGIKALKDFFRSIHMPVTMAELGVPPEAYEQIADLTTEAGIKTVPGFLPLTKSDLLTIYHLAEA